MPMLSLEQAADWLAWTSTQDRADRPEPFEEAILYCYDIATQTHLIWLSESVASQTGGRTIQLRTCEGVLEPLRAAIHKSIFRGWTVTEGNSVRAFGDHIHGFPAATMTVDELEYWLEDLPNGANLKEDLRTVLGKARTGTMEAGGSAGDSSVVGSEATEC